MEQVAVGLGNGIVEHAVSDDVTGKGQGDVLYNHVLCTNPCEKFGIDDADHPVVVNGVGDAGRWILRGTFLEEFSLVSGEQFRRSEHSTWFYRAVAIPSFS